MRVAACHCRCSCRRGVRGRADRDADDRSAGARAADAAGGARPRHRDQPPPGRAARARGGGRRRRSTSARRADMPALVGAGRLHADQPRRRVRRSAAEPATSRGHLPRRARQLAHAARPAVADLHRRPHSTRSSARRDAEAAGQRQGPRERARRSAARDHARVLGAGDRRRSPCASSASRSRASRRSCSDVQQRASTPGFFRRTTCSPSRRACRSSSTLLHRGAEPARRRRAPSSRGSSARRVDADFEPEAALAKAPCRCPPAPQVDRRSRPRRAAHAPSGRRCCSASQGADARDRCGARRQRPPIAVAAGYDYAARTRASSRARTSGRRRGTSAST